MLHGYERGLISPSLAGLFMQRGRISDVRGRAFIEGIDGDHDFAGLSLIVGGAQGFADDGFVSPHLRLHQSAAIVCPRRLPTGSSLGGDVLDVTVALGRVSAVGLSTASIRGGATTMALGWRR